MFEPIMTPIMAIGDFFILLYKIIKFLGLFLFWSIFFIKWLLTDLLNPAHFVMDFVESVKLIIVALFSSVLNILLAFLALSVDTVGSFTQSLWGWDQSTLSQDDRESNYFKNVNKNNNKKCYLTNTNTVPFSIILGTVLCPPIGVFMDLGITGWFNILICILLTFLFYIPGLIYALIIIYS
jgi:uncharacterized membrane protein YqaE (UPF0057 family)